MSRIEEKINLEGYISWLELFTEIDPEFEDDKYLYIEKNKTYERGNAQKLGVFYKVIDDILKEQGIIATENNYQIYHVINYRNVSYEIGFMEGEETVYYCKRLKEKDNGTNFVKVLNKRR